MVRVTADAFLAKVAAFYEPSEVATKATTANNKRGTGSVAITCKSVPVAKLGKSADAASSDEHVLLFRACKYGNNKHKRKISTTITAAGHAQFHAALSHIVKSKADAAAFAGARGRALSANRSSSKGKKATA